MFHIGQEVECVDAKPSYGRSGLWCLKKGSTYTVIGVGLRSRWDKGARPCIAVDACGLDWPLWAHRFRPIQKKSTDISCLEALLNPANHKKLEKV